MSKRRFEVTAYIYDKRGRVLSIGKNSYVKTHPLQIAHAQQVGLPEKCFLHAEIHAIALCKQLHKAHSMFIARYDANLNPRCAKPCKVCQSAIAATPIRLVDYTKG